MKKILVLAVVSLIASPAFSADLKWYGDVGLRYSEGKLDDGLAAKGTNGYNVSEETTKAHAIRGRLGASGGKDHVDYGFGFRTSNTANTDWVNYNQAQDRTFGIEQLYFRYSNDYGFGDISLAAGRQVNVFAYDMNSQQLFDKDVRFDGFGWKWKMGNFGVNASQYLLGYNSNGTVGATTATMTELTEKNASSAQSGWSTLIGIQPTFNFRFTDDIESMFAVGYYWWGGTNYTNNLHGQQGSTAGSVTGGTELGATQALPLSNARHIQLLVDTTLPYDFGLAFEYIRNKKSFYDEWQTATAGTTVNNSSRQSLEANRNAWSATLSYGKVEKAHDFKLSYNYANKGLASTYNTFSNNLFLADQKGHTISGEFAATDNLVVSAKYMSLKEISKKDLSGNSPGFHTTNPPGSRAGESGRSHTWKYWELAAGVTF